MRPPEDIKRGLVRDWIDKANEDLAVAQVLMNAKPRFLNAIGFHAQQAAEKYVKAFLVWKQIDFPKTHNIAALLTLICPSNEGLSESLHSTIILSRYCVEVRYPADLPELSLNDANTALELAKTTQTEVFAALQKDGY